MTDQDPTQPFEAPANPPPGSATLPPGAATPPPDAAAQPGAVPPPAPPAAAWAPLSAAAPAPGAAPVPPGGVPPAGLDVPIAAVGPRPGRPNPLRWIVAVLVVALVVAGGLGATLLLTSSTSGTSTVLGYVPADTLTYSEARLDLPGSQHAEVAKALSAFPGFADQSSLDAKLAEVYDRIIGAATGGKHSYQTEIAPWFGGQLAVAQGPQGLSGLASGTGAGSSPTPDPTASLPPCTGGAAAPTPSPAPSTGLGLGELSAGVRMLVLADVKDSAKAAAWVSSVLADSSATTSDVTCDGVAVHLVDAAGLGGLPRAGWAILGDKVLAAGDLTSIRLAIATKGAGGLSTTPNFQKAVAALPGDHLGFMYEALHDQLAAQAGALSALDREGTLTALYGVLDGMLPDWMAADVKASGGDVVMDTVAPANDVQPTTNRASDIAGLAPPSTIALVDVHDVGKTLGAVKDKLAADPKLAPYVTQIDTALGLAGGFAGTLGWIGDAGVAVTVNGTSVSGGLIIRPDDAAAAGHLFTQLRSLLDLAGAGSGISITDEQYKGATITTVDLSSLSPLLQAGLAGSLPGGVSIPRGLSLSYAATDKVVVLTPDPSFAKAVIDVSQGGASLAADPRFSALLSKAGDKNTGLAWLDITALRGLIETAMPADQKARYEADVKPYLLPFDALLNSGTYDNGLSRGTMILSIKH